MYEFVFKTKKSSPTTGSEAGLDEARNNLKVT